VTRPPDRPQDDTTEELRYERRLALKALTVLAVVAVLVVVRQLWLV
jgi:hypothetical protein